MLIACEQRPIEAFLANAAALVRTPAAIVTILVTVFLHIFGMSNVQSNNLQTPEIPVTLY